MESEARQIESNVHYRHIYISFGKRKHESVGGVFIVSRDRCSIPFIERTLIVMNESQLNDRTQQTILKLPKKPIKTTIQWTAVSHWVMSMMSSSENKICAAHINLWNMTSAARDNERNFYRIWSEIQIILNLTKKSID